MKQFKQFLFSASIVTVMFATNSLAIAAEFGESTTLVQTSLTKKIQKNLGTMSISISTGCHQTQESAEGLINNIKKTLLAKAKKRLSELKVSTVELGKKSDEINSRGYTKYSLVYPDERATRKAYVNNCDKSDVVRSRGLSLAEKKEILAEKNWNASLTISIEATQNLSSLKNLGTFMHECADFENKKRGETTNVRVSSPSFRVDSETQKKVIAELEGALALKSERINEDKADAQETAHSVDEAFYRKWTGKGLAKKTISVYPRPNGHRLSYENYAPRLEYDKEGEATGNVILSRNFNFNVSYRPKNLGMDPNAKIDVQDDDFPISVEKTLPEAKVDAYIAQITVKADCQPSARAANEVLIEAFNKAKGEADTLLGALKGSKNGEVKFNPEMRKSKSVQANEVGRKRITEEREEFAKDQRGQYLKDKDGNNYKVIKTYQRWVPDVYEDTCTGAEVTDYKNLMEHHTASQTFRVETNDFATYSAVKTETKKAVGVVAASAKQYEKKRYPQILPPREDVRLVSKLWREVVDVETYEMALDQLSDPKGEVAQFLTSEFVQASEAYYNLQHRRPQQSNIHDGMMLESAGLGGAPQVKSAAKAYSKDSLDIDDSNIDEHEEKAVTEYFIVWSPESDLMKVIENRAKEEVEAPVAP